MSALHIIPAAIAAGLLLVSASAMATTPYQIPGSVYSMNGAQVQAVTSNNAQADVNPAWAASAEGRHQNHR